MVGRSVIMVGTFGPNQHCTANQCENAHFHSWKSLNFVCAGWVVYPSQRNTHYRLSIIYAKLEDSDVFRCVTQHGLTSSVSISVTSAMCPELVTNARLNTTDTHIGAGVHLDCPTGSTLTGDHDLVCRDDATWSSLLTPQCQLVTCPPLEVSSPHIRLLNVNNSYLGTTTFSSACLTMGLATSYWHLVLLR